MTASEEYKIYQAYGFGETSLEVACEALGMDSDKFLRCYRAWASTRSVD